MLIEPFLRRLVVVGRDDENAVGTGLLGIDRELNGFIRRIRPCAGNHRHALLGGLNRDVDDTLMLFKVECRALARGPDRNQAVSAFGNLPIDKARQGRFINCAISERRKKRRD